MDLELDLLLFPVELCLLLEEDDFDLLRVRVRVLCVSCSLFRGLLLGLDLLLDRDLSPGV